MGRSKKTGVYKRVIIIFVKISPILASKMSVGEKGLEPSTSASQKQRSSQLSYSPYNVRPEGVEPPTLRSEAVCSIH